MSRQPPRGVPWSSRRTAPPRRRRDSTAAAPTNTCGRSSAFGPRPAGSAALEATRQYIKKQLADIGIQAVEQAFDADTPVGRLHMVNLIATHSRRLARPDRLRRPLRHQDLPGVPLRRRERRGVEHRVPDRVGARDEGAQEPVHRRTAVPRRRGGHVETGAEPTAATAAGTTSQVAGREQDAVEPPRADPGGHDWRPRPARSSASRPRRRG